MAGCAIVRLIIVRHGETEGNVRGIVQGHTHGKLTELGRDQARNVALELKDEDIAVIFSSDLRRAVHTAREIAKYHKVPINHVKELRERNFGVLDGRGREEFFAAEEASGLARAEYRPFGGESFLDLEKRIKKFTDELYRKYKNKTVLIITHSSTIRCFMTIYLHVPPEKATVMRTKNAGILIIEVDKSGARKIKDTVFIKDGRGFPGKQKNRFKSGMLG